MTKKGGQNEIDSLERYNKERSKALLLSAIFCVLGVVIVIALIAIGATMMKYSIDNIDSSRTEVTFDDELVALEYEATDFYYTINETDIEKANSFIVNKLGAEGQTYIIRSKEKLDELLRYLEQYGADSPSYEIDEAFFKSGSLTVVALEGKQGYPEAEQSIQSVARDKHYDLHLTVNANMKMPDGKNSRLTIIKSKRIIPQMVYLELK